MIDYQKYRWFFTSSGKLVIGGKSDKQNEELVKQMILSNKNYITMHTRKPGSPFTFLIEEIEKVMPSDLKEMAIFTGCFSQQWKTSKSATIDAFNLNQITKNDKMKAGTFGVSGKITYHSVELKLFLTIQKEKIRSVPFKTKESLMAITPGKLSKEKAVQEIKEILDKKSIKANKEEIMQAIPSGNIKIIS